MSEFTLRKRVILFSVLTFFIVVFALKTTPKLQGDGSEYLGMTISFANHLYFNLTDNDISQRDRIIPVSDDQLGYFPDSKGDYYSYHFWAYSLLNVIPYLILKAFNQNALRMFLITNGLLFILLAWWIIFRCNFTRRQTYWLSLTTFFSPAIFYFRWSHPEVFIFIFLFLGLLELIQKRYVLSCLFVSIASLQASPLILIVFFIIFYVLIRERLSAKQYVKLAGASLVSLVPFLFYWLHFHSFSLLVQTGASKMQNLSMSKVINLFFDPNFGLAVYYPLLFAALLILIIKMEKKAILALLGLTVIAFAMTSQTNWNSGMMYINRYCIWIVPLLMVGSLGFFMKLKKKWFTTLVIIYFLTTGLLTMSGLRHHDELNYLKFQPLASFMIGHLPMLYNPPPEVFAARALGRPGNFYNELPIQMRDDEGIRKELIRDSKGNLVYRNGPVTFSKSELYVSTGQK